MNAVVYIRDASERHFQMSRATRIVHNKPSKTTVAMIRVGRAPFFETTFFWIPGSREPVSASFVKDALGRLVDNAENDDG